MRLNLGEKSKKEYSTFFKAPEGLVSYLGRSLGGVLPHCRDAAYVVTHLVDWDKVLFDKKTSEIKLHMLNSNTYNHLTVYKQMISIK